MKLHRSGQKKKCSWGCEMAQFHSMMNANTSAGRMTGLHSSISASFRFINSRLSSHCIGQAGLLAWRLNRPTSNTGQNRYTYDKEFFFFFYFFFCFLFEVLFNVYITTFQLVMADPRKFILCSSWVFCYIIELAALLEMRNLQPHVQRGQ